MPWTFTPKPRVFRPHAAVRCADDVLALVTLARAGLGLIQTYDFLVEQELRQSRLVEDLRDYRGASRTLSLVYPESPKRTPGSAHAERLFAAAPLLTSSFGELDVACAVDDGESAP
jgi:DNA-binding transcriptional LysR family regulator